jgi:predicted GNAT family acetyltransferase
MHLLDNPTWAALTTHQAHWAQIKGSARRFPADVCVHGAFAASTPEAWQSLAGVAQQPVGIFSREALEIPPGWTVTRKIELYEMLQEGPGEELPAPDANMEVTELTATDRPEMSMLYEATRPGRRLSPRLHELGGFIGIMHEGRVVAMACLRLHLAGYREISTVGTLPGHTGRGYATALVSELCRRIHAAGEQPFLTVRTDNDRARKIYLRLGFKDRVRLHSTTVRWDGTR